MDDILNAIRNNEFNVLVDILSAQPDIDLNTNHKCGDDEWTNPLHLAALKCNLEVIEYLLSHGADINIKDTRGRGVLDGPFSDICIDSRLPIIEFLVRKGLDISPHSFQEALDHEPEVVRIYIKTYSKDVVMDWKCRIMAFEKQNDFEIIEYFIGAPDFVLEEHYKDEDTVGFLECTQKLLTKFIEKKSWGNAMRFILVHSYSNIFNSVGGYLDEKVKIIETIMENLTDFSYVDPNGTKFVDEIFRKCLTLELFMRLDENICNKLLEAGADKIILTDALMSYLRKGEYGEAEMNIVKKYVEAGVDLNLPSSTWMRSCPIHAACANQTREVIEFLIDHGADINIKDEYPRNALDYLVMVSKGQLDFSLIESFLARGADIEEAFYYAFEHDKEILRCLMRTANKNMALKPLERKRMNTDKNVWETWKLDMRYYITLTLKRELDFDILEYIIGAPDLVFVDFSILIGAPNLVSANALPYTYKMLNQFMENKSWEKALRLILVYLYSFDLTIDNHYSFGGLEDNKIGIFETIMENQIDFSYVDPHGTKFVDVIFKKYLELELFKQIDENVGKKLLEAGADRKILNEALNKYLDVYVFNIHTVKKYIEIGVDLNMSFNHNGEEIPLCDIIYMGSALHGHFELAEEMITKGANLDCILLSKEIEEMFTNDPFHEDRVQFVVDKLIAGGVLKDKNTKMGPRGESFVDFFAYHNRKIVLIKCGLLPKTPRRLTVTHSGATCCLSWEPADSTEDFPVTGYCIYSWDGTGGSRNREWIEVATIESGEAYKFEISGLKTDDVVKFSINARNYYGYSIALEDPEYPHRVIILPSPPGKPKHEVKGNDITITWAPPAEGGYGALTKYRVEGGNKGQDWKSLGTIAISHAQKMQWERKMKIFDFKRLNFNQVRVVAVNDDGDSEPSEPSVDIQP